MVWATTWMMTVSAAQSPPSSDAITFKTQTRLVVLPVSVLDAKGRPVQPPLPTSAFSVFEDGIEQDIQLSAQEDTSSSITLVIDHSGSMSYKLQAVAEGALTFVRASHPQSETSVISFSQRAYLDAAFTSDIGTLTRALSRGTIRGNTAIWDAVQVGIQHVNESARYRRRILILVSDGEDVASSVKLPDLIRSAQHAEVTIYAFGFGKIAGKSRRALKALAQSTGGKLSISTDPSRFKAMLSQLANDIRQQYTIAYRPIRAGERGQCHSVRITLKPGYHGVVNTRTGYCESAE